MFLISALEEDSLFHTPTALIPKKETSMQLVRKPDNFRDAVEKGKVSCLCREWNPGLSMAQPAASSLYLLRYFASRAVMFNLLCSRTHRCSFSSTLYTQSCWCIIEVIRSPQTTYKKLNKLCNNIIYKLIDEQSYFSKAKLYDFICYQILMWFWPVNEMIELVSGTPVAQFGAESSWVRAWELVQSSTAPVFRFYWCVTSLRIPGWNHCSRGWSDKDICKYPSSSMPQENIGAAKMVSCANKLIIAFFSLIRTTCSELWSVLHNVQNAP
jgi:hypothetical protein